MHNLMHSASIWPHGIWKSILTIAFVVAATASPAVAQWQLQSAATDADFRGLSVVSDKVAWASGTKGTFIRTVDGGGTWKVGHVPNAENLDFRDVEAFGENTAYLLSAGPGAASRIYKTTDGGRNWTQQFKMSDPRGFLDALAFWNERTGIALGDPVDGQFQLFTTEDGGANWQPLTPRNLPAALPDEGCFAASGTCLVTYGTHDVWFATGGAKLARVFHSSDRGQSWTVSETPVMAGVESAGIFSIAFRDASNGLIVGGDYRKPNETGVTGAITNDGGKSWTALDKPFPFRSCAAWAGDRWLVAGTNGADSAIDPVGAWKALDGGNFNSVAFGPNGSGWAVGPKGRIARISKSPMAP